jgi:transposase-like protein
MPKPQTQIPTQVIPDPSLERRTRRRFTQDYKLRILKEADACQHGELGPLLRREKLYAGQLSQWRKEQQEGGICGLEKSAPGPKAAQSSDQRRVLQLEKENARLRSELALKNDCLALQKSQWVILMLG